MKERENKSQRKRELSELHKLGEQLAQLSDSQLRRLELPERLRDALKEAKRITTHGARKRHFQFIAGIIRTMEPEELDSIRALLDEINQQSDLNKEQFHTIEKWRDRLLGEGPSALTDFLKEYNCNDIQHLRQLVTNAKKELASQKNLGGSKALFRLLKSIIGG